MVVDEDHIVCRTLRELLHELLSLHPLCLCGVHGCIAVVTDNRTVHIIEVAPCLEEA